MKQRLVSLGIVAFGGYMMNSTNPPEETWDWVKNISVIGLVSITNFIAFRKGFSLIRARAQKRIEKQFK